MSGEPWLWPYAELLEVHDGDTVKLAISQGFDQWTHQWIRLDAVRAPELSEDTGLRAAADCMSWFTEHAPDGHVSVTTVRTSRPLEIGQRMSFTRYIGTIYAPGHPEVELNAYLRSLGYTDQGL